MNLYEKYRPQTFEQVLGQDKAIKQIRLAGKTGFGGKAFWISGASGTGKTTLARIIASMGADEFFITEFDSADCVTPSEVDEQERMMRLYGFGGGKSGKAFIINEAHGLRRDVVRRFLGILERIPSHVVFVFTTTKEGMNLFEDCQLDASPLLSRCVQVTLTNQGLAKAFAEHCQKIAQAEGLDGKSVQTYVKLAQKCKNNCREMLMAIETGDMLSCEGV
jgi:DNA polymerase III gamma/tau subunit